MLILLVTKEQPDITVIEKIKIGLTFVKKNVIIKNNYENL